MFSLVNTNVFSTTCIERDAHAGRFDIDQTKRKRRLGAAEFKFRGEALALSGSQTNYDYYTFHLNRDPIAKSFECNRYGMRPLLPQTPVATLIPQCVCVCNVSGALLMFLGSESEWPERQAYRIKLTVEAKSIARWCRATGNPQCSECRTQRLQDLKHNAHRSKPRP